MKTAYLFLAIVFLHGAVPASGQSSEQRGYEVARNAHAMSRGYGSYAADGKMVLVASDTAQAVRKFRFSSLEVTGGYRSMLVFEWPGDIRDAALLTHSKSAGTDSQWVYLPASRRVKRISTTSRSGSFLGSEFSYEDLIDQNLDKFSYRFIKTEGCCNLVERLPLFKSGYSKQIVWFDTESNLVSRIDYYDRRGAKVKSMSVSGHTRHGQVWRPNAMHMVNFLTRKSTTLTWSNYRFGLALNPGDFSASALRRAR
jgi:hypothetical protein